MSSILVLGATGYIGKRLIPRLLEAGHAVRCLVRNPAGLSRQPAGRVEVFEGDVLQPETLDQPMRGIDIVYYLIHSMGSGEESFEELDRRAARNVATVAAAASVKRVIYLGGLGRRDQEQSPHLRSRHEVGDVLREGSVPVTEFRAAVVVGAGSTSFEMVHYLVNRLPVMICPRWVLTKTQPVAVDDVLRYLAEAPHVSESSGKTIDIGGPDILTYRDMMLITARLLGLKRLMIQVPVLTPRLSSYWVQLVTPIPVPVGRALVEGLRHETICENSLAGSLFGFLPMDFESAARKALRMSGETEPGTPPPLLTEYEYSRGHVRYDRQVVNSRSDRSTLFNVVASIGGTVGWYHANWLWRIRGVIDSALGGIGLRAGRRHPREVAVGDRIDCWIVQDYVENERLLMYTEMNVWGRGWLEFVVEDNGASGARLTQTAYYYPHGLIGHLYWFLIYPVHVYVFKGMARKIAAHADRAVTTGS